MYKSSYRRRHHVRKKTRTSTTDEDTPENWVLKQKQLEKTLERGRRVIGGQGADKRPGHSRKRSRSTSRGRDQGWQSSSEDLRPYSQRNARSVSQQSHRFNGSRNTHRTVSRDAKRTPSRDSSLTTTTTHEPKRTPSRDTRLGPSRSFPRASQRKKETHTIAIQTGRDSVAETVDLNVESEDENDDHTPGTFRLKATKSLPSRSVLSTQRDPPPVKGRRKTVTGKDEDFNYSRYKGSVSVMSTSSLLGSRAMKFSDKERHREQENQRIMSRLSNTKSTVRSFVSLKEQSEYFKRMSVVSGSCRDLYRAKAKDVEKRMPKKKLLSWQDMIETRASVPVPPSHLEQKAAVWK